jgi:hypothetical protein
MRHRELRVDWDAEAPSECVGLQVGEGALGVTPRFRKGSRARARACARVGDVDGHECIEDQLLQTLWVGCGGRVNATAEGALLLVRGARKCVMHRCRGEMVAHGAQSVPTHEETWRGARMLVSDREAKAEDRVAARCITLGQGEESS